MEDLLPELLAREEGGDRLAGDAVRRIVRADTDGKLAREDANRLAQRNAALVLENEMLRVRLAYREINSITHAVRHAPCGCRDASSTA